MKSLTEIMNYEHNCIDSRDLRRLLDFIPIQDWNKLGFEPKDGVEHKPIKYNKTNVLKHLEKDVSFGFEKALGKRGISASLMNDVVKMWLWVLDDEALDTVGYAQYGLPLLKAVAVKYGFNNQIGNDVGNEFKYSAECYC